MNILVTKLRTTVQTLDEVEKDLIYGLKTGDRKCIQFIYKRNLPLIRKMVSQYSNMVLESEDVMQEGLTRMIMNIREEKFKGKSSVHSYLYGICRNICLKEIERSKRLDLISYPIDPIYDQDDLYYDLLKFVSEIKSRLDEKCIKIIDLRFQIEPSDKNGSTEKPGQRFEVIAKLLGLTAENARQRFKRCLEKLISEVRKAKGLKDILMNN